jgi:hypothetical protein
MANLSIKTGTISRSMLVGNPPYSPPAFESIATISPVSASVSFTSIPSTYKHLQLRYMARVTSATTLNDINIRFNGDSGNNYAWHFLRADGTTPSVSSGTTTNSIQANDVLTGASSTSGNFGVGIIDIHDYASTTINKTARLFLGNDQNGSGYVSISSGFRNNTAAINRIDITQTFANGSIFSLYGIKGA